MTNQIFLEKLNYYLQSDIWSFQILGNSVLNYLAFIVSFVVFLFIAYLFVYLINRNLKRIANKTETDIDDLALSIFQTLRPPLFVLIAFYLSIQVLNISAFVMSIIGAVFILVLVLQAMKVLGVIIIHLSEKQLSDEDDRGTKMAIQTLGKLSKLFIWLFAILFILSNFGINITSLIAGLGIGGIAVALAMQNILGDLFSYLAINFDKPFAPGDFITVGDKSGVVEEIGIKTTRVRALQGEELVFANKDLSSSRIQNFKRMDDRRVSFNLGIVYGTPHDKLKEIPEIVKQIIEGVPEVRFDRAHLRTLADSALVYEVVYYVLSSDYNKYMDVNQEINLKIVKIFQEKGIEFAFPTQTINITK